MNGDSVLRRCLFEAKHPVFFGGAGVSTDSGIPDFRGTNGLYSTYEGPEAPEYLLSHTCLTEEPGKFYRYYRSCMLYPSAAPNSVHRALARLEQTGHLSAVITQNIDGLHQRAGSRKVYELHGSVLRNYCSVCGKPYGEEVIRTGEGLPICPVCGGLIRPDVVLYEEGLDDEVFDGALKEIEQADFLLVGGSSLRVNPAAWLVSRFKGMHLFIVNYDATPYDFLAEEVFHTSLAEVFAALTEGL